MTKPDDPDEIWKMASDDPQLIYAITEHANRTWIKVIEQRHNVIKAADKFIMAFWECDLTKAADA